MVKFKLNDGMNSFHDYYDYNFNQNYLISESGINQALHFRKLKNFNLITKPLYNYFSTHKNEN
tara:strand:+ start:349 stop:537 length:189 start_codon:yes stop_codon:yes gene_type:complete